MGLFQKMNEQIKRGIRSWLNIVQSNPYSIQIQEVLDFETNAIRNRIRSEERRVGKECYS